MQLHRRDLGARLAALVGAAVVALVVLFVIAAAPRSAVGGPATVVPPATLAALASTAPLSAQVTEEATASPSLVPTASPESSAEPASDPIQALLDDRMLRLDLAPLPSDAPDPQVTSDEAAAWLLKEINVTGPVEYVARGVGYINERYPSVNVWLIIAKVQAVPPRPEGPMCDGGKQCHWSVPDYAGGLVDDQEGVILRTFLTSHPVAEPSQEP